MVSFACPGAQPSLSGVRPPPGFIEPLWGPGNFQGRSKRQPSGRHRPSTLVELGKLPNRTTATITSVTAPVVTMASYGGVSTSTSLGRPFLSGHSPEQPGLGPMGQPQQQWSRAIPQGVQLPYTQGTSEIPMEKPVTGVFKGASPQLGSNSCSSYGSTSVRSIGSFFTARAAVGCYGPLPGYQVEPSELAPTKPISLGLTNFQQAKPE